MPTFCYQEKQFRPDSLDMIHRVNAVITTYQDQGYSLTLRQVYYRMVAADVIDNNDKEYKKLGDLISNARLAGLIDWHAIEDRTRHSRSESHWRNPSEVIESAAYSYNTDKWVGQKYKVCVWVEKDALIDVVGQACKPLDTPHFSCRGYVSATAMWDAAQRLMGYFYDYGRQPVILHLGDHDPSGVDMSRDIRERLEMFTNYCDVYEKYYRKHGKMSKFRLVSGWPGIIFKRIALNMDQIEQYDPPPNPAKIKDTRSTDYIDQFGPTCWELDALEPTVLNDLITAEIGLFLDYEEFERLHQRQEEERGILNQVAAKWSKVSEFVGRE